MKNSTNKETIFLIAFLAGVGTIILGVILGIILFSTKYKPENTDTTTTSTTSAEIVINSTTDAETPYKEPSQYENTTIPDNTTPNNNNSITIDSKKQYELNKFLSNFSETNLAPFTSNPDNYELIKFGLNHCHCNKYDETIEFSNNHYIVNGNYCHERLKSSEVIKTVQKYFGITLSESDFYGYEFYENGYVYCDCTGGFRTWGFTVVNRIEKTGSNTYTVYYDIYDDSYYEFSDSMYGSTPADMAHSSLQHYGNGTAVITAGNLNDRGTFKLKSYSPYRTF